MKDGKILTMHRKNGKNCKSQEHSNCCNSSAGEEWVSSQSVIVIGGMMACFTHSTNSCLSSSNCITEDLALTCSVALVMWEGGI